MAPTKKLKIAFICDPVTHFDKSHDSTWAMMLEAHKRGHEVVWGRVEGLGLDNHDAFAHLQSLSDYFFKHNLLEEVSQESEVLEVISSPRRFLEYPEKYNENNPHTKESLDDYDFIFMRKDPPFNISYVFATNILSFCKKAKVVNQPRTLRDQNEKVSILNFPTLIPATIVSKNKKDFLQFAQANEKVVFKPLDGKGGEGIFVVDKDDKNISSIIETLGHYGERFLMAQKYIPEISTEGDKRIILACGEPIGAMLRVPNHSDHRGNMAAGGSIAPYKLNKRDKEICATLKDFFIKHGIYFAGIDIIGGFLTEINITSPTCLQEINRLDGLKDGETTEAKLLDRIFAIK